MEKAAWKRQVPPEGGNVQSRAVQNISIEDLCGIGIDKAGKGEPDSEDPVLPGRKGVNKTIDLSAQGSDVKVGILVGQIQNRPAGTSADEIHAEQLHLCFQDFDTDGEAVFGIDGIGSCFSAGQIGCDLPVLADEAAGFKFFYFCFDSRSAQS